MKDLGAASEILSMKITLNKSTRELYVCQSEYTKKILKKFNMVEPKVASTPLAQIF